MSKKKTATQDEIDELYRPDYFYNYGDNPAHQRFMEMLVQNSMEGKMIDHRTYVIDTRKKLVWARNFDDFLHRDMKAINFVRAFGVWLGVSGLALVASINLRRFLPIGTRSINNYRQTSFFYNFGYLGMAGFGLYFGSVWYMWWKTTKFTVDKFYKHVILGERNWNYEQQRQQPGYGLYYFKDDPLSCEESFPDLARVELAKNKWPVPEWKQ